jgi:hypothetical protein
VHTVQLRQQWKSRVERDDSTFEILSLWGPEDEVKTNLPRHDNKCLLVEFDILNNRYSAIPRIIAQRLRVQEL